MTTIFELSTISELYRSTRLFSLAGSIAFEIQARKMRTRLTADQSLAISHFEQAVRAYRARLDLEANEHAMKALLEPQSPLNQSRAFFKQAKARMLDFGLVQFDNVLNCCEGSFAQFVEDVRCGMVSCRESHAIEASKLMNVLRLQDSTSDAYARARNEAAAAQGREEAYVDLYEFFEEVAAMVSMASVVQAIPVTGQSAAA